MSNRDLLRQFADGTPLDNVQLETLRADGWIGRDGTRWRVTTAGAILLGRVPPPGDSASCPDEDSYCAPPPQHSPGGWIDPPDMVNHPPHYKQGDIECIDAIRAALTEEEYRGYCKGNALKYIWRERHKGGDESLAKADWYLNRLVKQ